MPTPATWMRLRRANPAGIEIFFRRTAWQRAGGIGYARYAATGTKGSSLYSLLAVALRRAINSKRIHLADTESQLVLSFDKLEFLQVFTFHFLNRVGEPFACLAQRQRTANMYA